MKSINHTEPAVKPAEKPEVKKESDKSSGTGSIFTMFGAPLPEKKNSGTVKPVNKVEPEKKEPAKPEEVAKPVTNNVYERPATDSEKPKKFCLNFRVTDTTRDMNPTTLRPKNL